MQFTNFIKNNKLKLFVVLIVLLFVIGLGTTLFFWENNKTLFNTNKTSSVQGYAGLQKEFISLGSDPQIASTAPYDKIKQQLVNLQDSSLNDKQKFEKIMVILDYLIDLYSLTNNPKVTPMFKVLDLFTKENFPKYYKPGYFVYFCQDKSCAEHPQPTEMIEVVNEIQSSDIDNTIKNSTSRDIINAGYIEDKYKQQRFSSYLIIGLMFYRSDASFSATGKAVPLGKKILDYLKKTYPTEYANFEKNEAANAITN